MVSTNFEQSTQTTVPFQTREFFLLEYEKIVPVPVVI